ncbi:imidazolonepropionase [candidate division WOR-1 bacterium DG_54_3]|uniref:Imidazolonepropionase n=1 Tax=candidate division WOR-1 bacterium DG_54_3 TaxID=1703775 RepID=A0A0S7XMT9_UNCSA|nr:MAG: imidazolonepropionase [candidate division WOR-1 bacterium DG_54_3]
MTLIIQNARQLLTLRSDQKRPRVGEHMEDLGIIEDGAVAISGNKIVGVGKTKDVLNEIKITDETRVIDAKEKVVLPGFVDCHTHPVFAGTREDEFEMRVKGKTYQEIAATGGGIKSSVKNLRSKTKEELIQLALPRLDRMLSYGTTTIEAKSGYGLSLEDEIKVLEVIKEVNKIHPIDLIPTFLGAHEIPEEYKNNRKEYIKLITEKMIPEVARRKLAVFCDVFCEKRVFDIEESREILKAAKDHGFKLKLHADQLSALGGSKLAAELGAISADHLEFIDDDGIEKMKESGVIGVLLPGACFGLGLKEYPPARKMIERGLPVALATDFNPGSSMTESVPMILSLACLMMRMTPAEAIVASTINSAYAVDKANETGSTEVGKKADLVIWNVQSYKEIPYHYGVNLVDQVVKDGKAISKKI